MANLTLSQERIDDAMNVIVQFLRDSGYDGSLEEGTGLNDIVVKPNAILREMFAEMVDRAAAYQSLQKAYELKDELGSDEYDAAVDSILSNWFVTRNEGKPSSGVVRLWFLKPLDFVHYTEGQDVGTLNGEEIVADHEQVFVETDFSYILNTAENQNEYYIDVAVRTKENSEMKPSSTTTNNVSVTYNDIYFLRATVPGTFTPGILIESSEDFIRRTEQAITTRELITARAINTVILNKFSDVSKLYVARHGSPEQLRDIVEFQKVTVHVGNKADIYIASMPTYQTLNVTADSKGNIALTQLPSTTSVIAYIKATQNNTEIPLTIKCVESTWCSANVKPTKLSVDPKYAGTVTLTLLTDTVLDAVHNFVYSEEQRVACYDPMVKHMFPIVLYPTINVGLLDKTEEVAAESINLIKVAVLSYINYITKTNRTWVASEVVTTIHESVENIRHVFLPIQCTGKIYDPLKQTTDSFAIGSKFSLLEDYTKHTTYHSKQITDNTVQFYSNADLINIVLE